MLGALAIVDYTMYMNIPERIITLKNTLLYELVFISLALITVGLFIFELSGNASPEIITIIHRIDLAIVILFLLDFIFGFVYAPNNKEYLKTHWMDLVASIPVSGGIFQSLRILRLFRVGRVLGSLHRKHRTSISSLTHTKRIIYLGAFALSIVIFGATSFYIVEGDINPMITSFFDTVWWASVTATTVGYGEIYPLTDLGKVIGMGVMFSGVVLFGTLAGFMGSLFAHRQ